MDLKQLFLHFDDIVTFNCPLCDFIANFQMRKVLVARNLNQSFLWGVDSCARD